MTIVMMNMKNIKVESLYNFFISKINETAYFNISLFQIPGCKIYPFFPQKKRARKEDLSSNILQDNDH